MVKNLNLSYYHTLGPRGCVGLCLYNKMHGIKEDISSSEPKKTEVKV